MIAVGVGRAPLAETVLRFPRARAAGRRRPPLAHGLTPRQPVAHRPWWPPVQGRDHDVEVQGEGHPPGKSLEGPVASTRAQARAAMVPAGGESARSMCALTDGLIRLLQAGVPGRASREARYRPGSRIPIRVTEGASPSSGSSAHSSLLVARIARRDREPSGGIGQLDRALILLPYSPRAYHSGRMGALSTGRGEHARRPGAPGRGVRSPPGVPRRPARSAGIPRAGSQAPAGPARPG